AWPETGFVGWAPPLGSVVYPNRRVETAVLREVIFAIREKQTLRIQYQSMNRPGPSLRSISPHALGYDGFRWHVRAFCHEHLDFRDFVFARILRVRGSRPSDIDPKKDEAWQRKLDLVLAPHSELTPGQKRAVALDYGMTRGRVVLKTRQALA